MQILSYYYFILITTLLLAPPDGLIETAMDLSPNSRDRIFSAADQLYEAAGKSAFPTVDLVQKLAKVNMNDACAGMKEWRHKQAPPIDTVTEEIPQQLQQESALSLQSLWKTAVSLANDALRAAQATWQLERREAEAIGEEMANAYETLERESNALRLDLLETTGKLATAEERSEQLVYEHIVSNAAAEQARAMAEQIQSQVSDLRKERDQLSSALDRAHNEAAESRKKFTQELAEIRGALDTSRAHAAAAEIAALEQLGAARQEAAVLRASLDTLAAHGKAQRRNASAKGNNQGSTGDV